MNYNILLEYITIKKDLSIKKALEFLDKSKIKILFVVDDKDKLIGTLTDGDIRRFLFSQEPNLNELVPTIMNTNPKYVFESEFKKLSEDQLIKFGVNQLPIVTEELKIKSILEFNINFNLTQKYDNKIIIMAGGKGNRLLPLTKIIPKPLVPFKNKTIIETIMDNFCKSGFNSFYISINYKKELIKQYFKELNYNVKFIEESEFLGTAGSIGLIKNSKINNPIFVSNCDVLLDINFSEVLNYHNKEKSDLTIIATMKDVSIGYGVLSVDKQGTFMNIVEKPEFHFLINSGVYLINPNVIDLISDNERIDMPELINRAKNNNLKVKIFPTSKEVLDIGQWKYYKEYIDLE